MDIAECASKLAELTQKVHEIRSKLDPVAKAAKIAQLEQSTQDPNFWKNESMAKKVMQELSALKEEVDTVTVLEKEVKDTSELIVFLQTDTDEAMLTEVENSLHFLAKKLDKLEIKTYLSGPYDRGDAIVAIHSGQGGTEAMDWAAMLLRMYVRYVESSNSFSYRLIEETKGEEAGIKSATIIVSGANAYGYLKREAGNDFRILI